MFEVKKQVSIEIAINQDGLEKLINEEIRRQDPSINVLSIKFIQRRNPTLLEVEVEACMAGQEKTVASYSVDDIKEVTSQEPKAKPNLEAVVTELNPEAVQEEAPAPKTMKSLFDS